MFDFPSSLAFLPTVGPVSELVVASNQQERSPFTNDAVSQTTFNLPFIVAKISHDPLTSDRPVAPRVPEKETRSTTTGDEPRRAGRSQRLSRARACSALFDDT